MNKMKKAAKILSMAKHVFDEEREIHVSLLKRTIRKPLRLSSINGDITSVQKKEERKKRNA